MKAIGVVAAVCCCVLSVLSGAAFPQQTDQFESLLASAQQAQATGDFQTAAEFYRNASTLHPEIAELKANLGLMYFQTGKDKQAVEAFREAIRLKPGLFVPTLFLGLADLRLKRFEEAIPYLKRAALSKPTEVQTQLGLGEGYAATGKTRLAIASYLRATQLDPANADAWYHLGVSYLQQVEADARLLFTRHTKSAFLHVLLADNFLERRGYIQAEEAYKKALRFPMFPPGTHASYAFLLLDRHELPGADGELMAELASNPGSLMAKLGVARLHVEQGATLQGARELEEIFKIDAGFVRSNVARFKAGLPQEKSSELQHILEDRSASGESSREIAGILGNGTRETTTSDLPRTAASVIGNSVSSDSHIGQRAAELYAAGSYRQCSDILASLIQLLQAKDLRLLAFCSYLTGQYQRALDAATKLARDPATQAEGLYWETRSAQRLATETLVHASEMDSSSPKLHVLLGDTYRQRKAFPNAEKEYQKALALQPNDTGALFGLSLALLADEQIDEALGQAQIALAKSPEDPELNAVMGEILCARHDFSGAEPYLKKSLKTKPEYVSHVHGLLGTVYARTDRTQQAITELKLGLADDKDGHLHYQLARLYLKIGEHDAAKQAFDVSERMRREGLNRAAVAMQQDQNDIEAQ